MNVDAFYLPINRMMAEDCTLDDRIQADDCDIELGESVVTERARERVARALVRTEKSREGSRFSTYSCVAHTRANATSRDRTIDRTR